MNGGVRSEVGRLRTVLVHRPDLELQRLTPENMEELLFDELLWVERAQEEHDAFVEVAEDLAWAAGFDHARAIEPSFRSVAADREQWNDANNVFALGPGEVVAYDRNVATNEVLEEAGITVHRIPSGELPRGRGGPRCMTCPIARDPL